MIEFSPRRWLLIPSLGVALLLILLPLPEWATELRPPWVALTLLYWILAAPERVGVFWGWAMGLLLDVGIGTVLGQHALSLAVMAWMMVSLHRRLRLYPPVQQALVVWLLLLAERLVSLWVMGALGQPTPGLPYWLSTLTGLLIWPWIPLLTRGPRRGYGLG
ncbi:MAG: rod shape-determining protein MreD [Chromatiaceae bacterium]|jgi:rod shape-determining protein MreD|nr:rod shape-determining protein MreD [Chromatiaceae bacterium]